MNPIASRLKAIAVTALFFAISAIGLLLLIWGLAALPFALPGAEALARYRPHDSVAAVSDLRVFVVLTAAFLVASAIVLAIDSAYCDKMLAIFADVLLMAMAAIAGFVAGYWVLLRLSGFENFLTGAYLQAALVCPAVVFGISLLPPARLRPAMPIRVAAVLALLVAAPALLLAMG